MLFRIRCLAALVSLVLRVCLLLRLIVFRLPLTHQLISLTFSLLQTCRNMNILGVVNP